MEQLLDGLENYDPSKTVSKTIKCSEWPGQWPFTVDELQLCRLGDAVFVIYDDKEYALNGVARHEGRDNFTPIWKNNPSGFGKVDISEMIKEGLRL
jgi:hypothetical protein